MQSVEQLEYQPDDAAEPLTLEGISGMVIMDSSDGLAKSNQMKLDASDDNIVCDDDIINDLRVEKVPRVLAGLMKAMELL